jgi:hypothetical protein
MPGEGGKEGGKEDGGTKKGRDKDFTFPELMCCMWSALGTNERFSASKKRVSVCEQDKWRETNRGVVVYSSSVYYESM